MKKPVLNVEKLLKRYKTITLDVIFQALASSLKFEPEIVAKATWDTLDELSKGKKFSGDGIHPGSNGRELLLYIKGKCLQMQNEEKCQEVEKRFENEALCLRFGCRRRTNEIKELRYWSPWMRMGM